MDMYRVRINADDGWKFLTALAKLDSMHFINLNNTAQPFSLRYIQEMKVIEQGLKKLDIIERSYEKLHYKMQVPLSMNHFEE